MIPRSWLPLLLAERSSPLDPGFMGASGVQSHPVGPARATGLPPYLAGPRQREGLFPARRASSSYGSGTFPTHRGYLGFLGRSAPFPRRAGAPLGCIRPHFPRGWPPYLSPQGPPAPPCPVLECLPPRLGAARIVLALPLLVLLTQTTGEEPHPMSTLPSPCLCAGRHVHCFPG